VESPVRVEPAHDFAWRRKAQRQRDSLQRYAANRQRYIDGAQARKRLVGRERTMLLIAFFREHPCVDCSESDPVVLEFDHLGDKDFAVCSNLAERNWETTLAEMDTCEVVCANCHRRRTAGRRRSLRAQLTAG